MLKYSKITVYPRKTKTSCVNYQLNKYCYLLSLVTNFKGLRALFLSFTAARWSLGTQEFERDVCEFKVLARALELTP